ncbi:hypothetical protein FKW77_000453 [Venturia effusa]|uniref:Uncharacterized protein n=1 Tax=Venturia effusa TaxID=50376 RepID=A0A517LHW9_9PEZI|nr:hypothetical protein FKW77_000453 [Venturia effusa]
MPAPRYSPRYSPRSAQPSSRTRSRHTSQATTYVDPAYAYDQRDALLDSTRQGLHNVQQTYVKPIWEYDPEQVWTRKQSPNIPPLEHFLAEARARYNRTDPNYVNPLPEYWSQGGYEYGYPHGISPPHREDNVHGRKGIRDRAAIQEAPGACLLPQLNPLGQPPTGRNALRLTARPGHHRGQLGCWDRDLEHRRRIRVGSIQEFHNLFNL